MAKKPKPIRPTDEQLLDLWPWTLHRRMQCCEGEDLGPCCCDFCMELRRKRWENELERMRDD
jgi:hypothetical protein